MIAPGDVVTVGHWSGEWVVNVVLVGGREVSVSRMDGARRRDWRVSEGRGWQVVPVSACHPTGDRICAAHGEPFPCEPCAYLAGREAVA